MLSGVLTTRPTRLTDYPRPEDRQQGVVTDSDDEAQEEEDQKEEDVETRQVKEKGEGPRGDVRPSGRRIWLGRCFQLDGSKARSSSATVVEGLQARPEVDLADDRKKYGGGLPSSKFVAKLGSFDVQCSRMVQIEDCSPSSEHCDGCGELLECWTI